MASASLLVELHTEELPPKALKTLSEAFAASIEKGLRARNFLTPASKLTAYGSPRRLAVHITQVLSNSPDEPVQTKLMPANVAVGQDGKLTAPALKKLAAMGRQLLGERWPQQTSEGPDKLVVEGEGASAVLFLRGIAKGGPLINALQAALDEAIKTLPIPKVMSYQLADGQTTVQFIRPAHRLVALHGHAPLPVRALGLIGGTKTFGHRFHTQGEIAIHPADTYADQMLRQGKVIVSFEARRAKIEELVRGAAAKLGAQPVMPEALLDEVTALVEWPVVYASGFEAEFLTVPHECLILTMQQNQRYFALQNATGGLINKFLLVSNLETTDSAAIVAGNARVLRARLADAKFFFDQDRKIPLHERVPGLANVVYHSKLGSQLARVERITAIAARIAPQLGVDPAHARRAAQLAKADLRTLMVGEFPELQGTMGRYYALAELGGKMRDSSEIDIAFALEEHYRPRFADDALPARPIGVCVALADKIETLTGLFAAGERPTGDKDPYALRRHAFGILRLLMEKRLPLPLDELLGHGRAQFRALPGVLADGGKSGQDGNDSAEQRLGAELAAFLYDRLRGLLRDQGFSANEIESVLSLAPQRIDLVAQQLAAVRAFMQMPEAISLTAANKRIGNILKKSETEPGSLQPALLFEPAEKSLAAALASVQPGAQALFDQGDYAGMLKSLAPLKSPVDTFFDDVMVNVEDQRIRANRLALLAQLRALMNRVADLSYLAAG